MILIGLSDYGKLARIMFRIIEKYMNRKLKIDVEALLLRLSKSILPEEASWPSYDIKNQKK